MYTRIEELNAKQTPLRKLTRESDGFIKEISSDANGISQLIARRTSTH